MQIQAELNTESFFVSLNGPVILLWDKTSGVALPIWIGAMEANAIFLEMNGAVAPRPMTHDLLKNLVIELGGMMTKVVVTRLDENGTYHAELHVAVGEVDHVVDCRPSDGIALALRFGSPVYVEDKLFLDRLEDPNHEAFMNMITQAIELRDQMQRRGGMGG